MSDSIRTEIRQQIDHRGIYDRLLTTEEASAATGVSCYELRRGGKEGRYPVILLGRPGNKFRKMRWNLDALFDSLNNHGEEDQNRCLINHLTE